MTFSNQAYVVTSFAPVSPGMQDDAFYYFTFASTMREKNSEQ